MRQPEDTAKLERQVELETPERTHGVIAHLLLFAATAITTYVGYTLLFL